jgi:hypothetical protein
VHENDWQEYYECNALDQMPAEKTCLPVPAKQSAEDNECNHREFREEDYNREANMGIECDH